MPFVRASVTAKPSSIGTGVKAALRASKRGAPLLSLLVTDSMAETLGWAEGDAIEVLLGTGPEHGLVRMRKTEDGQVRLKLRKAAYGGRFFQLVLGAQSAFVNRAEQASACQWEVVEDEAPGTVEVVLPKWSDETHPERKVKPAEANAAPAAPPALPSPPPAVPTTGPIRRLPGRPPKNVTATLMGDPPPGRRQMLANMGQMKA